jgi:hypothetical protein
MMRRCCGVTAALIRPDSRADSERWVAGQASVARERLGDGSDGSGFAWSISEGVPTATYWLQRSTRLRVVGSFGSDAIRKTSCITSAALTPSSSAAHREAVTTLTSGLLAGRGARGLTFLRSTARPELRAGARWCGGWGRNVGRGSSRSRNRPTGPRVRRGSMRNPEFGAAFGACWRHRRAVWSASSSAGSTTNGRAHRFLYFDSVHGVLVLVSVSSDPSVVEVPEGTFVVLAAPAGRASTEVVGAHPFRGLRWRVSNAGCNVVPRRTPSTGCASQNGPTPWRSSKSPCRSTVRSSRTGSTALGDHRRCKRASSVPRRTGDWVQAGTRRSGSRTPPRRPRRRDSLSRNTTRRRLHAHRVWHQEAPRPDEEDAVAGFDMRRSARGVHPDHRRVASRFDTVRMNTSEKLKGLHAR